MLLYMYQCGVFPARSGFFRLARARAPTQFSIPAAFSMSAQSTMTDGAVNVDAAAAGAAASAGGDDDLVHFLVTNADGKGLPSFRLTIPKKHLESLPSSYLSAMSSERWVGNSTDRGTAVSPFAVSIDACPPNIRAIWDKYCHHAPDLVPFIQKAYASAALSYAQKMATQTVLPHGMELEEAVHFLEYYGLVPRGRDAQDMLSVPEDAPAAVMLRSVLFPEEARLVKAVRDALVGYIRTNPERTTYFVFVESSDVLNYIGSYNNAQEEGAVVPVHHFSAKGKNKGLAVDDKGQKCIDKVICTPYLRDKLISHLNEVDQLKAEFVTEETHLVELKALTPPKGRKEEQTLIVCDEDELDPEMERNMCADDMERFYERDNRLIRWRYVLKVQIPAV